MNRSKRHNHFPANLRLRVVDERGQGGNVSRRAGFGKLFGGLDPHLGVCRFEALQRFAFILRGNGWGTGK